MLNENHRNLLSRSWLCGYGTINWIMLNPSTADDVADDPTIRKCIGFSKRWGYRRLTVTNLFTLRATSPVDLKSAAKNDWARAVGDADKCLIEESLCANLVVAAWGVHGSFMGRDKDVLWRVLPNTDLYCIRLTTSGFPMHPLMAAYSERPVPFRMAGIPAHE